MSSTSTLERPAAAPSAKPSAKRKKQKNNISIVTRFITSFVHQGEHWSQGQITLECELKGSENCTCSITDEVFSPLPSSPHPLGASPQQAEDTALAVFPGEGTYLLHEPQAQLWLLVCFSCVSLHSQPQHLQKREEGHHTQSFFVYIVGAPSFSIPSY